MNRPRRRRLNFYFSPPQAQEPSSGLAASSSSSTRTTLIDDDLGTNRSMTPPQHGTVAEFLPSIDLGSMTPHTETEFFLVALAKLSTRSSFEETQLLADMGVRMLTEFLERESTPAQKNLVLELVLELGGGLLGIAKKSDPIVSGTDAGGAGAQPPIILIHRGGNEDYDASRFRLLLDTLFRWVTNPDGSKQCLAQAILNLKSSAEDEVPSLLMEGGADGTSQTGTPAAAPAPASTSTNVKRAKVLVALTIVEVYRREGSFTKQKRVGKHGPPPVTKAEFDQALSLAGPARHAMKREKQRGETFPPMTEEDNGVLKMMAEAWALRTGSSVCSARPLTLIRCLKHRQVHRTAKGTTRRQRDAIPEKLPDGRCEPNTVLYPSPEGRKDRGETSAPWRVPRPLFQRNTGSPPAALQKEDGGESFRADPPFLVPSPNVGGA